MSETKELITDLNQAIKHGDNGIAYLHIDLAEEIKSILEQQYQHEQNILNYGTDEPEEQQAQPDDESTEELAYKIYGLGYEVGVLACNEDNTHKIFKKDKEAKEVIRSLLQSRLVKEKP